MLVNSTYTILDSETDRYLLCLPNCAHSGFSPVDLVHIIQGYFLGAEKLIELFQYQWDHPGEYEQYR